MSLKRNEWEGLVGWHNRLILSLQPQRPIWVLMPTLAAPVPVQLSAAGRGDRRSPMWEEQLCSGHHSHLGSKSVDGMPFSLSCSLSAHQKLTP